jgi:hypothetical protein
VTNAQEKQVKGGKIHFDSQFQRFQFMVNWLHFFLGPWKAKNVMSEGHDRVKLSISSQPGRKEKWMPVLVSSSILFPLGSQSIG